MTAPRWEGPELDALAEAGAREWHACNGNQLGAYPWDTLAKRQQEHEIASFRILLSDLRRPAAMDAAARVLAARVGLVCGPTAPVWSCSPDGAGYYTSDGVWTGGYCWYLSVPDDCWSGGNLVTDPAEAMALALAHIQTKETG